MAVKKTAFAKDTAAKSGRSRTAVARDATCARALGPDLGPSFNMSRTNRQGMERAARGRPHCYRL